MVLVLVDILLLSQFALYVIANSVPSWLTEDGRWLEMLLILVDILILSQFALHVNATSVPSWLLATIPPINASSWSILNG